MTTNIQQSINQSLFAIGRVAAISRYIKGQEKQTSEIKEIKQAYNKHFKQLEKDVKADPKKYQEMLQTEATFDVRKPSNIKVDEDWSKAVSKPEEQKALESLDNKTSTLQNQKQSFEDRRQFLTDKKDPFQDELFQGGN